MAKYSVTQEIPSAEILKMFEDLELHPLTAQLLHQRGITSKAEALRFMNPSYEEDIKNPFDIHGVPVAVARIIDAMKQGEKIAVYSDYDCDGVPGGVLLRTFFNDIGYSVEMYIPHRHNEGYGLHNHAIDALKKKGVTLMITVDLAITNIEEVAYAKSVGVDVIVTDHHLPITKEAPVFLDGSPSVENAVSKTYSSSTQKKKLKVKSGTKNGETSLRQVVPDAVAVINSKQDVCTYHDDMLCGCAVAWKLSCALLSSLRDDKRAQESFESKVVRPKTKGQIQNAHPDEYKKVLDTVSKLKDGYEKWLLDLVGISTISDMVPLVKENRALAHFGLKVLRQTKRPGLNLLFMEQGIAREHIVEDDIAFTIAPRINAASRMGDPIQAHNMLFERDVRTAEGYVKDLEALNTERKSGVKDILSTISFDHAVYQDSVIVVGDISWGPGILGLIAQNIIDETGKPTFVWGQGEDKGVVKGSCRSRGDVSVVELMARASEMYPGVVLHSGGHEQAGGFECALDKVGELSHVLNEALNHVVVKDLGKEELVAHAQLSLTDVHLVTYNAIAVLAPFGVGNVKPLFAFSNVAPTSVRWFGKKSEHLEIVYPKSAGSGSSFPGEVKAIMFFAPKELAEKAKETHTLLAHIEKSMWKGRTDLRLRIREVI